MKHKRHRFGPILAAVALALLFVSYDRGAAREPIVPQLISLSGYIGLTISAVMNIIVLLLVNDVFNHLKAYVAGNLLLLEELYIEHQQKRLQELAIPINDAL